MGAARFVDSHSVVVGERTRIRGRYFLICTGARSQTPVIDGLAETDYWTYESVWTQTRLPRRLLVLGSGPVGTELSQAFARLGSQVTVFERGDRPLRLADPESSDMLRTVLEHEGVQFRFGAHIESVRQYGASVVVTDRAECVEGDDLLVAAGRRRNVQGLNLERAGVKYSERAYGSTRTCKPRRSTSTPAETWLADSSTPTTQPGRHLSPCAISCFQVARVVCGRMFRGRYSRIRRWRTAACPNSRRANGYRPERGCRSSAGNSSTWTAQLRTEVSKAS